jgi:tetratricopeptide (TPR) repeat protein
MLLVLGGLDLKQERYMDALVIYNKAKAVLAQHKEGNSCGAVLNDMAVCHKNLQQWSEAVACLKEGVEHSHNLLGSNHPNYATALYNLAILFARLKQYEEAIPPMEEALDIRQRVFGDQHDWTVQTVKDLALVRQHATQSDRGAINVGHNFRMCSLCGAVSEMINTCPCVRAVLQSRVPAPALADAQAALQCLLLLQHGSDQGETLLAKYCNAACQTAHWSEHKKDCMASK